MGKTKKDNKEQAPAEDMFFEADMAHGSDTVFGKVVNNA